ncbi:hypothetical protein ACFWOX_24610 [Streptomyces sp. NPDC058467]|uniref:hypothetical protein n=1 Tax=Streptomyces sp. NPDC058467 TaxID=3346513 RepID=UPI00365581CB
MELASQRPISQVTVAEPMVLAVAQAWYWADEGAGTEEPDRSWSSERLALHRSAVVEATRRLTEPKKADG